MHKNPLRILRRGFFWACQRVGFMYNRGMQTYLKVKVHAGEKKNALVQKTPDTFEIWVKAPAEQGRANEAVRTLLAQHLGVAENKLSLVKGATSPSKIFLQRSEV